MNSTATSLTLCPFCGAKLNKATHLEQKRTPRSGDITVCFTCLKPLIFSEDLVPRKMTDEEWFAVCDDEELYNDFKRTISHLKSIKK